MTTRTRTIVAGLVLAAALAGGVAYATIPAADGTINGCYRTSLDDQKGQLRIVDDPASCRNNELPIQWNQEGPQGDTGAQGIQGIQGDTGATGAQGPKGDTGDTGAAGINGTNGVDGEDGQPGTNGTNGVDGAPGAPGDPCLPTNPACLGPKGDKGDKGDPGTNGTNGVDGAPGNLALAGKSCATGSVVSGFDAGGNLVCATGASPLPARLSSSTSVPFVHDFGSFAFGTGGSQIIVVKNDGGQATGPLSVELELPVGHSLDFFTSLTTNDCSSKVLFPSETCNVKVFNRTVDYGAGFNTNPRVGKLFVKGVPGGTVEFTLNSSLS